MNINSSKNNKEQKTTKERPLIEARNTFNYILWRIFIWILWVISISCLLGFLYVFIEKVDQRYNGHKLSKVDITLYSLIITIIINWIVNTLWFYVFEIIKFIFRSFIFMIQVICSCFGFFVIISIVCFFYGVNSAFWSQFLSR